MGPSPPGEKAIAPFSQNNSTRYSSPRPTLRTHKEMVIVCTRSLQQKYPGQDPGFLLQLFPWFAQMHHCGLWNGGWSACASSKLNALKGCEGLDGPRASLKSPLAVLRSACLIVSTISSPPVWGGLWVACDVGLPGSRDAISKPLIDGAPLVGGDGPKP